MSLRVNLPKGMGIAGLSFPVSCRFPVAAEPGSAHCAARPGSGLPLWAALLNSAAQSGNPERRRTAEPTCYGYACAHWVAMLLAVLAFRRFAPTAGLGRCAPCRPSWPPAINPRETPSKTALRPSEFATPFHQLAFGSLAQCCVKSRRLANRKSKCHLFFFFEKARTPCTLICCVSLKGFPAASPWGAGFAPIQTSAINSASPRR